MKGTNVSNPIAYTYHTGKLRITASELERTKDTTYVVLQIEKRAKEVKLLPKMTRGSRH